MNVSNELRYPLADNLSQALHVSKRYGIFWLADGVQDGTFTSSLRELLPVRRKLLHGRSVM